MTQQDQGARPLGQAASVAVLGLGYVGLPTALACTRAGCHVTGIDTSPVRLEAIGRGDVDLSAENRQRLVGALANGRLALSADPACVEHADVVIVCVPTPIDQDRMPDLGALAGACESVVTYARRGQSIVLTSTAHVGATRELIVAPLRARGLRAGDDVFVCFSPERIDPGVAAHAQAATPRVIGGASRRCVERARSVIEHTCSELHLVSSLEAAEMTKLYENTFRAVNIALSFEIADACESYGIDPIEVTDAAATKPYAFMAHYPSAGVGGHCIGVDPYYLLAPLRARGRPAHMTEHALSMISERPGRVAARALELLGERGTRRVLVVGAAYKPGVADMRQSPGVAIIGALQRAGADVSYHDPLIPALEVDGRYYEHIADVKADAYELAVLVTAHPGHDYAFLDNMSQVLDCTYRTRGAAPRHTIGARAQQRTSAEALPAAAPQHA